MLEQYDQTYDYCRKLGHHLHFKYCRSENNGQPCPKIFDCWFEKFNITDYMQKHYPDLKPSRISAPSKSKSATIYDLIQQAQSRIKKTS